MCVCLFDCCLVSSWRGVLPKVEWTRNTSGLAVPLQERDLVEFRHYGIKAVPSGVSRAYVTQGTRKGARSRLFLDTVRGQTALFVVCLVAVPRGPVSSRC